MGDQLTRNRGQGEAVPPQKGRWKAEETRPQWRGWELGNARPDLDAARQRVRRRGAGATGPSGHGPAPPRPGAEPA
jgi:hypothetical protein